MTTEAHKSQRSVERLLGQSLDTTGKPVGAPIECQIAYPYLHVKKTKSAGNEPIDKPYFSVTVKVPKLNSDATKCANYAALAAHCMESATKAWNAWPQGGRWPIQDGDQPYTSKVLPGQAPMTAEQVAERNKWRVGHWIIEPKSYLDTPPRVAVVQNGREEEIKAQTLNGVELYKSGDYGYVFLGAWSYQNKLFGVNFGFSGVCFTRSGEKIGGGAKTVQAMFGGVGAGVGAGMATATPPGPPQGAPVGTAPMPPAAPIAPPLAPPAPLPPLPVAAPAGLAPFPTPGA